MRNRYICLGGPERPHGKLLGTGQTTCYHVGDDGDSEVGLVRDYRILTTNQYSGTTNIDVPHYAAATLTFAAADKSITDSANGLVTFLNGDTIVVHGSASNDGTYTIASGGGAAGHFHTTEALVNEAAGAYITICKRSAPSNNCVLDAVTGLMWKRNTTGTVGTVEPIGPVSDGKLNWYDATTCFTLHSAAADLQMMATGIKIVGGAAELPRYYAGQILVCAGFANAVNNLPGYRVLSAAVNGADLDILLWTGKNVLLVEAAGGARSIAVICRSVFAYAAAANAIGYAGYSDWRIPNDIELFILRDMEIDTAVPNATAFPNWPVADNITTRTTVPSITARINGCNFTGGNAGEVTKISFRYCALVRG